MCGIFALLNPPGRPVDLSACRVAVNMLSHRGPDAYGEWVSESGDVFLGHRRLSIIDLSDRSNQPMAGASGHVLIYNGEIFNFRDIRRRLQARGQVFETSGDTEVALKALETWGPDCLEDFEGMFAMVLWDPAERSALAARDFFGIKPLYMARTAAGGLAISSEIKSFYALPEFRPELNRDAIPEYLRFRCVTGEATLLKGVEEALAGQCIHYKQATGEVRKHRYWNPIRALPVIKASSSPSLARERFTDCFRNTLASHLIADVTVGVQFSGGIDSGIISAIGARDLGAELLGFHCRVEEPGFNEARYAEAMAKALGVELFSVSLDRPTFFSDLLEELTWFHDEPLFHPNSLGIHLVSRLAKGKAKALLSGEAADEFLGGYSRYPLVLIRKMLASRPIMARLAGMAPKALFKEGGKVRKLIDAAQGADQQGMDEQIVEGLSYMSVDTMTDLLREPDAQSSSAAGRWATYEESKGESVLARCQLFDIQTYLPPLFMRQDKMSMAASIENRVPFATPGIFRHAFQLHEGDRASPIKRKAFLRSHLATYVPKRLLTRGKAGFGIPLHSWLTADRAQDRLRSMAGGDSKLSDMVDLQKVARLVSDFDGTMTRANELWTLLTLDIWAGIFLRRSSVLDYADLRTDALAVESGKRPE